MLQNYIQFERKAFICLQSYTLRIYFHSVHSEQVCEENKSVLSPTQVH